MIPVVLAAVFAGCLVTVYTVHRMLLAHQKVLAQLLGRHARDLTHELSQAEERISETARTGLRARGGPARLRDHA
jgi:hypothetical protein